MLPELHHVVTLSSWHSQLFVLISLGCLCHRDYIYMSRAMMSDHRVKWHLTLMLYVCGFLLLLWLKLIIWPHLDLTQPKYLTWFSYNVLHVFFYNDLLLLILEFYFLKVIYLIVIILTVVVCCWQSSPPSWHHYGVLPTDWLINMAFQYLLLV